MARSRPYGSGLHQLALVLVVYTFCVACVPILAPQFRLFVFFVLLVFVPAIVRVALQDATLSWELAIVMTVAMGMTILLGRNYRASFDSIVGLKLRTEALAVQLRSEKAVADAARREAEVANRAKTQFFAAASHDLRQPLHAMGLFAEALRARSRDPEVAQLVNSINESVDALEGLFSELLDITRIDSGGVEVHPADFELADIFRKVRLHFEPAAFEKGLALRVRGGRRVAFADPLLVERIVRNLVSNAIRYTSDGSVLVSCRRRGERLLLQVWDTGPGIGAERTRARVRGVLPGAGNARTRGRAEEGPRPRPGDRQATRRPDRRAARAQLRGRPRFGVHARAAGRQGAARGGARDRRARRRPASRSPGALSSSSRTKRRCAKASRCC